ncbi:hypothetical protein CSOJ01_12456 [Colletotrichum sojae]|uniref:Uncharacterized protein n=1 Tax=Colletotrichum sojae TaxID=2175907 RepID=A0A8H6MLL3_9PEZI|nr:hypothetical protein CSOJ01_12456 [Colletotrichum sojae]
MLTHLTTEAAIATIGVIVTVAVAPASAYPRRDSSHQDHTGLEPSIHSSLRPSRSQLMSGPLSTTDYGLGSALPKSVLPSASPPRAPDDPLRPIPGAPPAGPKMIGSISEINNARFRTIQSSIEKTQVR